MPTSYYIVALLIIAVFMLVVFQSARPRNRFPYQRVEALFTPAERDFLLVLEQAVRDEFRVFGKVRIADIVSVRKMPDRRDWLRAFNKISSKHVDFVLCRPGDLAVVAVLELDDRSHQRDDRARRDEFIEGVFTASAVPLIRVPARRHYATHEIREQIRQTLQAPGSQRQSRRVEVPDCPDCIMPMVRRKVRKGPHAGAELWGCVNYPNCRQYMPIERE